MGFPETLMVEYTDLSLICTGSSITLKLCFKLHFLSKLFWFKLLFNFLNKCEILVQYLCKTDAQRKLLSWYKLTAMSQVFYLYSVCTSVHSVYTWPPISIELNDFQQHSHHIFNKNWPIDILTGTSYTYIQLKR